LANSPEFHERDGENGTEKSPRLLASDKMPAKKNIMLERFTGMIRYFG
jgi:hypothetical protein